MGNTGKLFEWIEHVTTAGEVQGTYDYRETKMRGELLDFVVARKTTWDRPPGPWVSLGKVDEKCVQGVMLVPDGKIMLVPYEKLRYIGEGERERSLSVWRKETATS